MTDTNPYMGMTHGQLMDKFWDLCEAGFTSDEAQLEKIHTQAGQVADALDAMGDPDGAKTFRDEFGKLDFTQKDDADKILGDLKTLLNV